MTRFNPDKRHRDAIDWSTVAWRTADEDKAAETFVIGLVAGTAIASVTTPLLGGVIGAYFVVKGIQRATAADKNKKYIRSTGCVAHVLDGGNFRAYRNQVGDSAVLKELEFADQEGLTFSDDALDFWEDYQEQAPVPAIALAATSQQTRLQSPTTTLQPKTQIDYYDPTASAQIDIIGEMVERITNTIVIGIPGSGKGILISNAIREAKRKHPKIRIFVLDPKADPKEAGYWEGCDVVKSYGCMDAKPSSVAAWAEAAFDEYAIYAQKHDRTLLIVDEGTMLGNKLQQAKSTLLVDKLTSYTSGGDSAGRNVWFMMQSPYVGGASLNLSTTSQMTSIVIAFSENIGAIAQWKSAKIFKSLSLDEVSELIEKSTTGRAIYYGKTGRWYMMPKLTNYSGYDRDQREYLPDFNPQTDINETDTEEQKPLSKHARLVLEWLTEKRKETWVKFRGKEGRDMTFIKLLSGSEVDAEERDQIIQELVNAEKIELSPEGDRLRVI